MATDSPISFRRLIGVGIAAKLLIDIGNQIFNPFLAVFAAGMGVDVITMGRLIGLRSAMGIFAPVAGTVADRTSYRRVIRITLLLTATGFLLLGLSQGLLMVAAGMVLTGLGAGAFVPNLQAYISAHLPYNIRARGLGMLEYSWALTGIVGLSLVGLLIQATGWRTPLFLLAVGMVGMSFVFARMPAVHGAAHQAGSPRTPPSWSALVGFFRVGPNWRSTYATIAAGSLCYFAAMQMMIVHGVWLQEQFGLSPAQLGLVAFVFGWFDLLASVAVSLFTDRIGKKRSVIVGIVGSLVGYLLLPFLAQGVLLAVVAIGIPRMFFEFNIVSHFPLLSEQVPAQRGKVMTLGSSLALIGATVAGFTGPWLLVNVGIQGVVWTSAVAATVGLAVVLSLVHEATGSSDHRLSLSIRHPVSSLDNVPKHVHQFLTI